jgi:hypothetical protein
MEIFIMYKNGILPDYAILIGTMMEYGYSPRELEDRLTDWTEYGLADSEFQDIVDDEYLLH